MKKTLKKQNIFIVLSFIFIFTCIFVYGGRLVYFYKQSKKVTKSDSLVSTLKMTNVENKNFKVISANYYFTNDADSNYAMISGIPFRILKIDADERIYLISESSVTSLAFGEKKTYDKSYINMWLNKSDTLNTGIFEKNLDIKNLTNTKTCLDKKDKASNAECKNENSNILISLLDMQDYANSGADKSFVNTKESFYLVNTNSKGKVWYVDANGGLSQNDGTGVLGVKPVITLKSDVTAKGTGKKDDPYIIEGSEIGSYVKFGNDTWRIYDIDEGKFKLQLTSPIKVSNKLLEYAYSTTNYKFNDTKKNTLAYYLNHDYLNKLSYKNIILEDSYSNGYYGADNDYNYTKVLSQTIKTKVGMLGIGDIMINGQDNYALMTGINKSGSLIYVGSQDSHLSYDDVTSKLSVIPCISVKKESLTKGTGTKKDPYGME